MRPCSAHLKASGSSTRWLARQRRDPYVLQRSQPPAGPSGSPTGETYRSRSSFKLVSLARRYPLFPPGRNIIDLGAAPGGWSQVAKRLLRSGGGGGGGKVIALDFLPFEPIDGVDIIQGDFLSDHVRQELAIRVAQDGVGCVLSDMMAPMSGVRMRDVQASLDLVRAATDFAMGVLASGHCDGDDVEEGGNLV